MIFCGIYGEEQVGQFRTRGLFPGRPPEPTCGFVCLTYLRNKIHKTAALRAVTAWKDIEMRL